MISVSPEMRALARWLLERDAAARKPAGLDGREAIRVCEELGRPLSAVAGVAGYNALLSRAVELAKAESSWLKGAKVNSDGSLDGLGPVDSQESLDEAARGGEILVVHLLGLLAVFIGQPLTLRLVRDVWPEAPFAATDPESETRS